MSCFVIKTNTTRYIPHTLEPQCGTFIDVNGNVFTIIKDYDGMILLSKEGTKRMKIKSNN